jgi:ectoine hydroxylase-related dioxygenase (phytanoyl-CoA dioxygenase family)
MTSSAPTAATRTPGEPVRQRLTTLPGDSGPSEIISAIERDGAVIVRDFIKPSHVEQMTSELGTYVQSKGLGAWPHPNDSPTEGSFAGANTKRIGGLAAKSSGFVELLCNPTMLACADHFVKPNCGSYYLNGTQLMVVGPGATPQHLHRDEGDWPHLHHPKPHLVINFMCALTDFTAANGATRIVPGSHKWSEHDRRPREHEITQAEMPRGSVLFYDGKIMHGAGANTTADQWRWGLWFAFCVGWLRQYENQFLAVPPPVARNLPKKAQELLGYKLHNPSPLQGGVIGGVDLGVPGVNDPAQVLQ